MTQWDPTSPPLMLPSPPNRETPGMGGYPIQGLWSPEGEGNPLLWRLVDLLTRESERPQQKGSRKNIVDRRGGRIPLETKKTREARAKTKQKVRPKRTKATGYSPLDELIAWIDHYSE